MAKWKGTRKQSNVKTLERKGTNETNSGECRMISINTHEAIVFERLIMKTRDTKSLQVLTDLSYLDCINLLNKLRRKLERE